ncbi:AAA family ATPase [Gluconobacter cerinus]|uniref:AAA family ATPase n=1 Tax=Gluconobacter cerinus TaxID=38307 RepID=UPI001B8D1B49|nr:ATP-binding protein [Gluconobacter cerinus]MBS1044475.1 ATP-binding protein [Gluconobacter cerinus]
MILDFTVSNFRSFRDEQTLSMNVEGGRERHTSNFSLVENKRFAVLRSAGIFGANASGKTNILRAFAAIQWIITSSAGRKETLTIPPYEPFRLSPTYAQLPVSFEVEFIVPSGGRYRYEIAFLSRKIVSERLISFARRSRATIFERLAEDTWETVKFGGTFKGGNRKFPFFDNAAYLSRAGNDPSSPDFIREIYKYFESIRYISPTNKMFSRIALKNPEMMLAVSELLCLADTGVDKITIEENEAADDIRIPESIPEELRQAILAENRMVAKFWMKSGSGELIPFDTDDISHGTSKLFDILPVILEALEHGSVIAFDEIDAHLHTDIIGLVLKLFHDDEINIKGSQIIFSTHDTNVLDAAYMRRDQLWFVSKEDGISTLKCLSEYDKKYVRQDSPFEAFYRDGRLGALPALHYKKVKKLLLSVLNVTRG